MKKINEQLIDKLEIEGVNANGYGILPKIVMQDNRLTIEAKAIYAYIVSYAGAGNSAFPSLQKILSDLQIGENRFYKHRKLLIECNYITVTQIRNEKKEIIKNLYTLIANPKKEKEEINNGGIPQNEGYPTPQNEGHIINSVKINSLKDDDDKINARVSVNHFGHQWTKPKAEPIEFPSDNEFVQAYLKSYPHLHDFGVSLLLAGVTATDCLAILEYLATLTLTPEIAELVHAQIRANEQEAHTKGLTNYKAYFLTGLKQKLDNADITIFLEQREIDVTDSSLVTKQPKVTLHNWVTG